MSTPPHECSKARKLPDGSQQFLASTPNKTSSHCALHVKERIAVARRQGTKPCLNPSTAPDAVPSGGLIEPGAGNRKEEKHGNWRATAQGQHKATVLANTPMQTKCMRADTTRMQRAMRRHPWAKASTQLYASKHTKVSTQNWVHVIYLYNQASCSNHNIQHALARRIVAVLPHLLRLLPAAVGVGLPCWQQHVSTARRPQLQHVLCQV